MLSTVPILLGWLFTVYSCDRAGVLVLQFARVSLYREEERYLRFILGSGCFSLVIFALTAAHLAYEGVFLAAGALIITASFLVKSGQPRAIPLPDYPLVWKTVFLGAIAVYGVYYFVHALAPETSPDGATYHLGIVGRYLRQHSFGWITTDMYANLSEGIEMLFLAAYSIGRHSSAALVEFTFLLALPFGMLSYARRIGFAKAGVLGALIVYTSPVFGMSGTIAYNDAAGVAILFALFYLLQIWSETRQHRLVPLIGLAAGSCYAAKYTLFLALPFAGLFLLWKLIRARASFVRPLLIYSAFALLLVLPWMAKNWITVQNPFSPFANRLFPNPYITIHFEDEYGLLMRTYIGLKLWQRPFDHIVSGAKTSGLLGPIFLLAPLSLLALRFRQGRQLLLMAVVFILPAYTNIETRFLMPMAPFFALALGLAVVEAPLGIPVLLAFSLFTAWPGVIRGYSDRNAWRLNGFYPAEAFRVVPETVAIRKRMPAYDIAQLMEKKTPPGSRILSFSNPPEAYTSRELIVKYESALGNYLGEMLWAPMIPEYQPLQSTRMDFSTEDLRKIRIVQTAARPADLWTVSDVRFFDGSSEVKREGSWRLRSSVNTWDLQRAFDSNDLTLWSAMQPTQAGMYIEVDFGGLRETSAVVIKSPVEPSIRLRLETERSGKWRAIESTLEIRAIPAPQNLRGQAMEELKRNGIFYFLVAADDFGKDDFFTKQKEWNIQLAGEAQGSRLYRVL